MKSTNDETRITILKNKLISAICDTLTNKADTRTQDCTIVFTYEPSLPISLQPKGK